MAEPPRAARQVMSRGTQSTRRCGTAPGRPGAWLGRSAGAALLVGAALGFHGAVYWTWGPQEGGDRAAKP